MQLLFDLLYKYQMPTYKFKASSLFLLFTVMFPSLALSETDFLGLQVQVQETCPISKEKVDSKVRGEFTKARLKPSNDLTDFLTVTVSCIKIENNLGTFQGYTLHSDVRMGITLDNGSLLVENYNRGGMMVGNSSESSQLFYFNVIRDQVSEALVSYIENPKGISLTNGKHIIYLMTLKDKQNAHNVADDLNRRGYHTSIKPEEAFYRVVVTVDGTISDAQKTINNLEELTGSKGRLKY